MGRTTKEPVWTFGYPCAPCGKGAFARKNPLIFGRNVVNLRRKSSRHQGKRAHGAGISNAQRRHFRARWNAKRMAV